jgi:hypothetical protein
MRVTTFTLFIFFQLSFAAQAQITVHFPPARMVYQRNTAGNAVVYINGTYTSSIDKVQARLKSRPGEPGSQVGWTDIAGSVSGSVFSGSVNATGGRYDLEVRGMKNGQQVGSSATVEKVGVGEVFLIVGHSNAAAAGESIDMLGAESDLVNTIDTRANPQLYQDYLTFGTADYLPPLKSTKLCQSCGIAPMAEYPWLWSRLGDLLVAPTALNVPVLFYSAAFGGSNMGATYKSAYNIPFDHGFIKYSIRMPYANIRNAMNAYAPRTGLRAILSMHGINDLDTTADGFRFRNQMVIEKTRQESGYQQLPWMVATSCYNDGVVQSITDGQEAVINSVPNVFRGADLNKILNDGQQQAAQRWRDAILDPVVNVRQNAQSFMASAPPLPGPPLPVTLVEFRGMKTASGPNELEWVTSSEVNNDYFEIQKSRDAVRFEAIGNVKGAGESKTQNTYTFSDESPERTITYYRLKQVDFDGTESLSRIVAVQRDPDPFKEFVYPNPAEHYIEIATDNGDTVEEVTLFDLKGNAVLSKTKSAQVDISRLRKGDYFIQFRLGSGQSVRKKIAKM